MLKQFCHYNNWANAIQLDALKANAGSLAESSVALFSHIVNAQTIWLSRINGYTPTTAVWQVNDLETCNSLLAISANELLAIDVTFASGNSLVKYNNTAGDYFETSVADIILHVCNHGTYHRAQIAREMKLQGLKPVNTDYIQFVRLKS